MKNVFLVALLSGIMMLFSACASIIKGGGDESFTFKSDPTSAQVIILDLKDAKKLLLKIIRLLVFLYTKSMRFLAVENIGCKLPSQVIKISALKLKAL